MFSIWHRTALVPYKILTTLSTHRQMLTRQLFSGKISSNCKSCSQACCRAPEGFSVRLIVPGSITTDQTECPDNYISVLDPYNVKTYKVQPQQWVLCPGLTSRGETTLFESFLNVIRLTERTAHTLETFVTFQANYSVTAEQDLAGKMSFIRAHFEGMSCSEVS